MAFSTYTPSKLIGGDVLKENEVSIGTNGTITLRTADMEKAGLGDHVVLMTDPDTMRLAIRKPRDGEADSCLRAGGARGSKRAGNRTRINGAGAIKAMGLDARECAGRREVMVKKVDGDVLLIIPMGDPRRRK